jgi:hypothetical protein
MSSLKKTLMKQGMRIMSDPRVMKLMQDERVMKAVMQMMSVPGAVQTFTHEQVERLAKSMALATEDEVKDLKRTVRRLEEEVGRMKNADKRADKSADKDERPSTRNVAARKKSAD